MATRTAEMRPAERRSRLFGLLTRWRPESVFFVVVGLVILYITLVPVLIVIWGSFFSASPGVAGGHATLENYQKAFSYGSRMYSSAINTVMFALIGGTLTFVIGTYFAWLVERTNIPFKPAIFILMLIPHILPGILQTCGWLIMAMPKSGWINQMAAGILPFDGPLVNIYSWPGMVWVFATDSFTLSFLLMAAAFRSMDPALEEAATASGSSLLRTIRTVTLPVLLPAALAAWILAFMRATDDFEISALIGMPAGIVLFPMEIYASTRQPPVDLNRAAVMAVVYLIPGLLLLLAYSRATRASERYATITGKNYRPTIISLGYWRPLIAVGSFGLLAVMVVLPVFTLLWASFMAFWMPPGLEALKSASFDAYTWTLNHRVFWRAVGNTAWIGVLSTTAVVVLGALTAWIVLRTRWPGRRLLDFAAFSPIAVSTMILAIALIWLYLMFRVGIYGTTWILVLGFTAKYMPHSMRFNYAGLSSVSRELEDASAASGAGWGRTFWKIIVPLVMPSLVGAWIYIIILTFKVTSLPVMLSSLGNIMISALIFDLAGSGRMSELAALGIMLIILLTIITLLARTIGRRFGVKQT